MSDSITQFVQNYLPFAQSAASQTGLPVDYILAQSAEETGFGTSSAANVLNNFFGISPGGTLASYSSPQAGFQAYADLLSSPRYSGVASAGSDPVSIGNALVSAGYNTADPSYASKIANIVPSIDAALGATGNGQYATSGTGGGTIPASASVGTAGGSGSSAGAAPVAGNCGLSPSCWFGYLGSLAVRASFVLIAIIFLIGAIYIFGRRTENA